MNILKVFQAINPQESRGVAKIISISSTGYVGETSSKQPVVLEGNGYEVGQMVFYDRHTRQILATAPNVEVIEIRV